MPPNGPREPYAGPEAGPEAPFPIKLCGPVIKGFGRGSKELGIPTANIPTEGLSTEHPTLPSGIYYGFVGLSLKSCPSAAAASTPASSSPSTTTTSLSSTNTTSSSSAPPAPPLISIHPAVLSIGFNPFYKNTVRSVEIHILHEFPRDFYGAALNLLILGYIRPEYDYVSVDALVEDIRVDCAVAARSLERPAYARFRTGAWEAWLTDFSWMEGVDAAEVERGVLNQ
ncbi:uncharacterized protein PV07_05786 [Cladophialophora immunda]|uniref:Riboflavin kinase n=1 Tax=Cladophialophora immunda TaxID=569365 RepID=A0A0D2CIU7_9EURO|nr:uncharacterized protein PV07_05786 [Cladophialophora immunda]KIW30005.1 hypothetical protein PV07_05786 [Cladophialophora immunda]OQV08154.1 hypothetical protein CLAIMM_12468 [Cladophialophora immunda]